MSRGQSVLGPSRPVRSKERSFIQRTVRMAAMLAVLCVLLVLTLSLWNLAVTKWQHAHNPVLGNFYSIDGRLMHLYCSGADSPTIVIEAGASAKFVGLARSAAAAFEIDARLHLRSRGTWLEPASRWSAGCGSDCSGTACMLDQAGVQRSLVLTGHSAGGLYVREYAREFPAEVAGVVLIDSSSPEQIDEVLGWRQSYEADKRDFARRLRWEELRVWSGWERLMGNCRDTPSAELRHLAGQYDAEMCRPEYVGGEDAEFLYFETTCKQAARLTSFANIPLLIISQDPDRQRDGMSVKAIAELPVWAREQEALKSLSPLSWRVIARGAGHGVQHDRLDVVVAEMTGRIGYLRGGPTPPFGSTVTE